MGHFEVVLGGASADGFVLEKLFGDRLDGGPGGFVGEHVLGLIESFVDQLGSLLGVSSSRHCITFDHA